MGVIMRMEGSAMTQKIKTRNRCERLRVFQNQIGGERIGKSNALSVPQPPPVAQHLIAAIDRLCARALALAFFDFDATAEIELARRLAAYADRRAAA